MVNKIKDDSSRNLFGIEFHLLEARKENTATAGPNTLFLSGTVQSPPELI